MGRIPQNEIYQILSDLHGTAGLYVEDCSSGEVFTVNPDLIFPSCSVIKIPILGLLLLDAAAGKVDMNAPRHIAEINRVAGTGILHELDHDYDPSLYNIAKMMIIMSDNMATNEIMDIIGIERFNAWCQEQGHKHTVLMRKMMDFVAIKQGRNNYMTAGDAGEICSKIAKGEYLSPEISDTIRTMMLSQQYRNKLPALIPAIPSYSGIQGEIPEGSVLLANKTGDLVGIQHDVGIFELPDHRRYVISMFTGDLEKDCDGIQAIGKVSKVVYEALK